MGEHQKNPECKMYVFSFLLLKSVVDFGRELRLSPWRACRSGRSSTKLSTRAIVGRLRCVRVSHRFFQSQPHPQFCNLPTTKHAREYRGSISVILKVVTELHFRLLQQKLVQCNQDSWYPSICNPFSARKKAKHGCKSLLPYFPRHFSEFSLIK